MRITVVGKDNTTQLQGAITVKAVGAHVTALDNNASFAVDYGSLVQSYDPFIKTINGIGPNSKGEFFIHGSECDSWDYLKDGHGISIVDLCPACRDCELIYRLKQEAIRMKLWLAVLRDVNLYQSPASTQEAQTLWGYRLPDVPSCGKYILGDTFENFVKEEGFKKGLQLIQQYMTTVHMWNYLVNRNNKSDVIQIAPEDTSGFSVQTKRSVTECGSAAGTQNSPNVQCAIRITGCHIVYDSGTVDGSELASAGYVGNDTNPNAYPVSMLIPRAVVSFTPFMQNTASDSTKQAIVGIPATTTVDGIVKNMKINAAAVGEPAYQRSVDTTILPVVAAGTYSVTVKFLPFIYTVMEDAENNAISIRGTTAKSVDPKEQDGEVIFQFYNKDTAPVYIAEPTTKNYIDSKTAPTCSVDFKLMWDIEIVWSTKDKAGNINTETQTYNYVCNGIRRSYSSSVIGGSTINISGGTEQSTDA